MRSHCDFIDCQWNPAFINHYDIVELLSRLARQTVWSLLLLVALSCVALAQLPGDPAPAGKPPDAGSVLIYNYYSSGPSPANEDTVIELTNKHKSVASFVHLFFIDGNTCSVADTIACLAPRDTLIFRVSDVDPQINGYIVAIAIDSEGLPINFNFLSGHEEIKLASGHKAEFDAVAIRAIASNPAPTPPLPVIEATLNFDGIHYEKVPRVLELEPVYSVADGNSTLLVVNRLGGSVLVGFSALGPVQGIFTNLDSGTEFAFTDSSASCRLNRILSNTFPAITPVFSMALPSKQEGNLKIWATADLGVSGVAINFNSAKKGKKLNSGDNLRAVTLTTASFVKIVFPAGCYLDAR